MKILEALQSLRDQVTQWRKAGLTVGFVPTMGNLHSGHLTLVDTAKQHCDKVIVSIFVNPMQFGANEDLDTYPRTIEQDKQHLVQHNADVLFLPSVDTMYPRGLAVQTFVEVPGLSDVACGASRPGHFRGVATVVCKLFNMVQPDHAFFGQKDYQQLKVIRTMTEDLSLPVTVHGVPTQRDASGLALSSRNGYLSEAEKAVAPQLYAQMCKLKSRIEVGDSDYSALSAAGAEALQQAGFKPDYVDILNANTLNPAQKDDKSLVILVAAYLGSTRLIDNIEVTAP